MANHFVSASCQGEKCSICGEPASHKVGEEIPPDFPPSTESYEQTYRHNYTGYVCCEHFSQIMGPLVREQICRLPPGKTRKLVWVQDHGVMAECLGLAPDRARELTRFINGYIARNATLRELIDALNARGDQSDAEWSVALYTIGYYQGRGDQ